MRLGLRSHPPRDPAPSSSLGRGVRRALGRPPREEPPWLAELPDGSLEAGREKAESPRHGTCCGSGQQAAAATRGHPRTARGPLPARQLPQKPAAGAERWEREDGRLSQGDVWGRMSTQRWLIAPAAGTERLCQTASSHGARLHTTLRIGSLGLLLPTRRAGACGCSPLSRLARLRALSGWEHPSPALPPASRSRLCCQPRPRARQRAAAGPSACFHVCDVSDCVCRVLVDMGRRQRREGEGATLREASEKKNQTEGKKKPQLREIPLL